MADTVTPNMKLTQPEVSAAPGPGWATTLNGDLSAIDSHNHTSGQGVQITPAGLNISTDLSLNSNNAVAVRSIRFTSQSGTLVPPDSGCIYENGSDLWFTNGGGTPVQITNGSTIVGTAGSIGGLPSGSASANYGAGTFTWQSATNVPASMNTGPLIVGAAVALSNTVTIAPSNSLAASYSLTLPAANPVSTSFLNVDSSGNMGTVVSTGSGSVVLSTTPTISNPTVSTGSFSTPAITTPNFVGLSTGTIVGGTYNPTTTNVSGTVTVGDPFFYTRVGNIVSVVGYVEIASTNSSGILEYKISLPINPTNNFVSPGQLVGGCNVGTSVVVADSLTTAASAAKLAVVFLTSSVSGVQNVFHGLHFTYSCA